jgi:hypothetical protein
MTNWVLLLYKRVIFSNNRVITGYQRVSLKLTGVQRKYNIILRVQQLT